jgi:hypothetical protein
MGQRASPHIIRASASGIVSIIGRTSDSVLKASVSWELIEAPRQDGASGVAPMDRAEA